MKRSEMIIIDLKVKSYDTIRLKQLDTTELNFKILDNSLEIDLSELTAEIIFKKPNGLVIIQECSIQENLISVTLIDDCVRMSGEAGIEIELKKGTDIISSFCLNVFIERTAKEDIKSENAEIYIEKFEKAIAKLQEDSQKLLETIETEGNSKIEDIENRYIAMTQELEQLISNYNELVSYIQNISNEISNRVDEKMHNYMLKDINIASILFPERYNNKQQ